MKRVKKFIISQIVIARKVRNKPSGRGLLTNKLSENVEGKFKRCRREKRDGTA